ncbi:MAG: phage portal protein, partial [Clostridia bacterium]|nr:phage portal protein [Clostridia bacterium]
NFEKIFRDLLTVSSVGNVPENAEKLGAVAAAHRILTNSLAAMPWQIRRREGEQRFEADHALAYPLKTRANDYMSPYMAEKVILSRAFWYGAGYAYIERDERGAVSEIIPIPAEPEISMNARDNMRWYKFTVPDTQAYGKVLTRNFAESQILRFLFETYDGVGGRGMLHLGEDTIDTDLKAQKYGNRFYTNGARLSGVIEVDAELGPDKRTQLKEEFNRKYSGDNAFKVAVLDLGMKYTQLGISHQEAQYLENREFSVEEVSRATGIPLHMLQSGKQSYQSNEQQRLDFLTDTLTPHLVQIEQEWKYKLFSKKDIDEGYYLKKNENSIMRGTHEARANYYQKMIGIGAMCADDIRADEDRSPLPDGWGKKFWMSKNFAPVDDEAAFRTGSSAGNGTNAGDGTGKEE